MSLPSALALSLLALLVAGTALAGFQRMPVRRRISLAALIVVIATAGYVVGCAGGPTTITNPVGTPVGTYTIKVTATSGTDSHSTTVSLTVQ
jgi:hypothetical protein